MSFHSNYLEQVETVDRGADFQGDAEWGATPRVVLQETDVLDVEGMRKLKFSKTSGEIDMIHIEQSHRNPTWFYLFWAAQGIRKLGSGWSLGAKTYDIPVFFVGVLPSCQACQNPMWSDQGLVGTPWANNEWFGPVMIQQHLPSKRQWNPKIQGPAVGLQSARFPGGRVGGRFLWFRVLERLHFTLQPRAAVYVHCTWTSWMWFG